MTARSVFELRFISLRLQCFIVISHEADLIAGTHVVWKTWLHPVSFCFVSDTVSDA